MSFNYGYSLSTPKAESSHVRVKAWTGRETYNVGVVKGLKVNPAHWAKGGLSHKAPQGQRDILQAHRERLQKLQADLIKEPRLFTPQLVKDWMNPVVGSVWPDLFQVADAKHDATGRLYFIALQRYQTFTKGEQPTPSNFNAWGRSMASAGLKPRSTNSYQRCVAACLREAEVFNPVYARQKETPVEAIALTAQEVDALLTLDLVPGSSLYRVRDAFVVACYTSLRLSDWQKATSANIGTTITNQKTKKSTPLPDHHLIRELLSRNGGDIKLPNAPNKSLRKVLQLASETCPTLCTSVTLNGAQMARWEAVRTHTGRRSFVSNAFARNVPVEAIIQLTGHASVQQVLTYHKQILSVEEQMSKAVNTLNLVFPEQQGPNLKIA